MMDDISENLDNKDQRPEHLLYICPVFPNFFLPIQPFLWVCVQ